MDSVSGGAAKWVALWLIVALLLLAGALRLHQIGAQSFWNDEGNSLAQARRDPVAIAENAARDIHPPGYYWLLAAWRNLVGESEVALRSLSALVSLLTVALAYSVGRRLFNPAAGLAAAFFTALNTFSLYYAQEARMYALLGLWAALSAWALVGLLRGGGWKTVLLLALVNAAGLYTQYAYPFVMLAQGAALLLGVLLPSPTPLAPPHSRQGEEEKPSPLTPLPQGEGKRVPYPPTPFPIHGARGANANAFAPSRLRVLVAFVLANGLALLLFAPLLPTALRQVTQWPSTGAPVAAGEALATISGWLTFGLAYGSIENSAGFIPIILLILSAGALLWLLRGRGMVWRLGLLLLWVVVPVGLFLLLGLFRPANLKFLLPAQFGLALWMGAGWGGWWQAARRGGRTDRLTLVFALLQAAWLIVYFAAGVPALYTDAQYQRSDYRAMAARISADSRPGDVIILNAPNQREVFDTYYHGDAPVFGLPEGLGGDDVATLAAVRQIVTDYDRIFVLYWGDSERDPNHVVESTLDAEAFAAGDDVWYGEVRFARYAAPATMQAAVAANAPFGDSIWLEHYALSGRSVQAGDVLQIELQWRTDAPLTTPYKVFVQLLNAGGVLVAQRDSEPGGGSLPTTVWPTGETLFDRHGLAIPADLPAGDYLLILGLYNRDNAGERLPTRAGHDYLELGLVTVR
jgi:hypothetical protein